MARPKGLFFRSRCVGSVGEDEFNDPIVVAFRVKFPTDGCHRILSKWMSTVAIRAGVGGRGGGGMREGDSWWQVTCRSGGLCLLLCRGGMRLLCLPQLVVFRATGRPSSCSLKASTPHEAPTSALTTETLAAASSRWGRAQEIDHNISDHKARVCGP